MLPLQQPLGHEVALHTHPFPVHCWPTAHCDPPLHVHPPAVHPLAIVVSHVVQAPPPAPQLVTEGTSHVDPEQQPDAHVCAHDWHTPLTHESPPGHAAHAAPFVPHEEGDSDWYGTHVVPLQQPAEHELPSHTHLPPTHSCPEPQAWPVPQVHTPAVHASPEGHAAQAAPPVPQKVDVSEESGRHVLPLQQPLGHEVALQTHPEPVHCWPAAHCAAPLQVHAPAVQPLATVVLHAVQAPPPVPQFVTEGVSQVIPEQQPEAQLPAPQVLGTHVSSVDGVLVDWHTSPLGHCPFAVHCTQAPLSTSPVAVAHTGVEPPHRFPSSAQEHCRQPLGVDVVPVQMGGTLVLDVTHALSAWLQIDWTVQVLAPTVIVVSCPLHRSPISPHLMPFAYQAIG